MIETLLALAVMGGFAVWGMKREAKRLGIPWDKFMKMSAKEKKDAGARI
jgi:hypothetical protein